MGDTLKTMLAFAAYGFVAGAAYIAGVEFIQEGKLDDLKHKVAEKLSK